jgi:diguanylate cyclase (GGDEF)-like protein
MRDALHLLSELVQSDESLTNAGRDGEIVVAKFRLAVTGVMCLLPVFVAVGSGSYDYVLSGVVPAAAAFAASVVILRRLEAAQRPRHLSLVTSILDVTLVSMGMFWMLVQGHPVAATNSHVSFLAYFLALGATCVRWDTRASTLATVLALVQYSVIVVWSWSALPAVPGEDSLTHGQFSWGVQIGRLVMLALFGLMCAMTIRRSRLLRTSSISDALTGLMNRRYLEERLEEQLLLAERTRAPLCVALLDVDHFKRVNDEYGHDAGDAALVAIARRLHRALRRTDFVARWGGEEFAIVMPGSSRRNAFRKLDAIRAHMAAAALDLPRGISLEATLSGGVASYPEDGLTLRELILAADLRLLEAKRTGRNKIATHALLPAQERPLGVPVEEAWA